MHIPEGGEDMGVWIASKDGLFSVSSFFSAIHISLAERIVMNIIWKIKAPPRVVIFGWMAIRKRILTLDNLRGRGRIVVNGCQEGSWWTISW